MRLKERLFVYWGFAVRLNPDFLHHQLSPPRKVILAVFPQTPASSPLPFCPEKQKILRVEALNLWWKTPLEKLSRHLASVFSGSAAASQRVRHSLAAG